MNLDSKNSRYAGDDNHSSSKSDVDDVFLDKNVAPCQTQRDERALSSRYEFRHALQCNMDATLHNIFSNPKPLIGSKEHTHDEDDMRMLLEGVAQRENENDALPESSAPGGITTVRSREKETNLIRHLDAMSIHLHLDPEHLLDKENGKKTDGSETTTTSTTTAAAATTKTLLSSGVGNKSVPTKVGSNVSTTSPCTNGTSFNDSPLADLLTTWVSSPYPRMIQPIKSGVDTWADDRAEVREHNTSSPGSNVRPLLLGAKPDVSCTALPPYATSSMSPSLSCTTDRPSAGSTLASMYDVPHIAASITTTTTKLPDARHGSARGTQALASLPAPEFCTSNTSTNINSSSTHTRDADGTSCTTVDFFPSNLSTTENVGIVAMNRSSANDRDFGSIHPEDMMGTYMNSSVPSVTIVPSILPNMSAFDPSQKSMQNSITSHNKSCVSVGDPDDEAVRSNLFVSGLSPDVRDEELKELFAPYGEIESAKVMLNIHSGLSRCIAFVKFTEVSSAAVALEKVNGSTVRGHQITVRIANSRAAYLPGNPTNKTFVRNVPLSVTRAELMRYFSKFGEVTDISIHTDTTLHRSNERDAAAATLEELSTGDGLLEVSKPSAESKYNFVFVTFTTNESAAAAAEETHTKTPFAECNGVPLLAKVAEDSARRIERLSRRYRSSRLGGGGVGTGNASTASMHSSAMIMASASGSKSVVVGGEDGGGGMMCGGGGMPPTLHYPVANVVHSAAGNHLLTPPAMMEMGYPARGEFHVPTPPTAWGGLSGASGSATNVTWAMNAGGVPGAYTTSSVPEVLQQHQQSLYNMSTFPLNHGGGGGMVYASHANTLSPPAPHSSTGSSRESAAVKSATAMACNPTMVYSVPPVQQQFMFVPPTQPQQLPVQTCVMPQSYTVPVQPQPFGPMVSNVPGSVMYTPVNIMMPQCAPQQAPTPNPYYIVMNGR